VACAACCAIFITSSPIVFDTIYIAFAAPITFDTIYIAFAAPITLDVSQRLWLTQMATSPGSSTSCARFDEALVPIVARTYPIVFGSVDNRSAVLNTLDTSRCLWFAQTASRAVSSTWCVRFVHALITDASRTFLIISDIFDIGLAVPIAFDPS
jgi:hypothetical protein